MTSKFLKECVRVFLFAAVPVFIAGVTAAGPVPDWNTAKAAAVAAIVGAASAGIKAVVDLLTKGVYPVVDKGILPASVKR